MTTKTPVRSSLTASKVASTDAKSRLESFSDKMVGVIKAEIPSSKVLDFGVTNAADVGYMSWCHFLKGPLPQGVTVELKATYNGPDEVVEVGLIVEFNSDWPRYFFNTITDMNRAGATFERSYSMDIDGPVDASTIASFLTPVKQLMQVEARRRDAEETFPKILPQVMRRVADQLTGAGIRVGAGDVVEYDYDDPVLVYMMYPAKPFKTYYVTIKNLQKTLGVDAVPADVEAVISGAVDTFSASGGVVGSYHADTSARNGGFTFKIVLSYKSDGPIKLTRSNVNTRLAHATTTGDTPTMTTNPQVSIRLAYADFMRKRAVDLGTRPSYLKLLPPLPPEEEPVAGYDGIARLVRRLEAGDEVEITYKGVGARGMKKSLRVVESSWQDLKDANPSASKYPRVFLQAKVKGRYRDGMPSDYEGMIRDYDGSVQWQPTRGTPFTPVLALRKV